MLIQLSRWPLQVLLLSLAMSAQTIMYAQSLEEFRRQAERFIEDYALEDALDLTRIALNRYPGDPALLVTAASLSGTLGDRAGGERLLNQALSSPLLESGLLLKAAEFYLNQGQWASAISVLSHFVQREAGHPRAHYLLGRALFFAGDDRSALKETLQAVELLPGDSSFRRWAAILLARLGRREEAFEQLRVAQRLAPDDARILLLMADKERHEKRWERAMEYLEMAASKDAENPLYQSQLADIYETLGMLSEARIAHSRARRLEEAFDIYRQALRLKLAGQRGEAIRILEPIVEEIPRFMTGAAFLADLYREEGLYLQADNLYRRLLGVDPENKAIHDRTVRTLLDSGRMEEAFDLSLESAELGTNDKLLMGYERMLSNDWQGAVQYFKEVEADYPLHPELLRQISLCFSYAGETDKALAYLEKAFRANPGNSGLEVQSRSIRFDYAQQLERKENWSEALSVLQQLNREEEESAEYLFHMAYCLQNIQRYAEAAEHYSEGLLFQADTHWARINLAYCLYFLSRFDEASAQWEYLTNRVDKPEYVYHLGMSRIRQWRLDEGWSLIRRSAAAGYEPACRFLKSRKRARGHRISTKTTAALRN